MRSVKLTQALRDHLCGDMIRHRFGDDFVALRGKMAEFVAKVYRSVYSRADRERIGALPSGWLPQAGVIQVQFGSDYTELRVNGAFYGSINEAKPAGFVDAQEVVSVPAKDKGRCLSVFDAKSLLAEEFVRLRAEIAAANNAVDEAKRQIKVTLNHVSTTTQLVEAWPEAAPFVKPYVEREPSALLPAVPVGELNALLKLPAESAAA